MICEENTRLKRNWKGKGEMAMESEE